MLFRSLTAPYPFNLTDTANFDPPGSSTQASLIYDICANPTVTFTTAQNNLDLYLIYFRNASIVGVATYTLTPAAGSSGSWAIQSGLSGASVAGNTLTASTSGYNNGIVRFTGTLTGFTVTAVGISSTEYSSQAFTMAVPPAGPTCDVTNAATYSQGGWGNTSKGTALTSNFFQTKFSNGLSAGNGSRLVNFASEIGRAHV